MPSLLADIILLIHAAFVLFVVAGQVLVLLGWWRRWGWVHNPWFRLAHLLAIGYVVMEAWLGITCPLTVWEYELRRMAGESVHEMSFIAYWVQYFLFYTAPEWVFVLIYTAFGALVLATFVGCPPRFKIRPQIENK